MRRFLLAAAAVVLVGALSLWGTGAMLLSGIVRTGGGGNALWGGAAFCGAGVVRAAPRIQEAGEGGKVVIVIDPGHGGENRGTKEGRQEEKYMTMTTALAMYEELLLYENVEVYLTRTDDEDVTLKKRAEFAKSVDADFLYSIHYNASENHELYGSEVWVPAFAPYNACGYQFGCEILADMRELGLLVRGVKTRLGDKGLDYYGIIRESVERDIPAVIIEHCHVDEPHDAGYCDDDEKLRAFGRMDAAAAARYFGLKSSELGVDYSDHPLADANSMEKVKVTQNDSTEPDVCQIALAEADYGNGTLALTVTGTDYDSALLYYSVSLDGGKTFGVREPWPDSDALAGSSPDMFTLRLEAEPGTKPEVVVRAYNSYDLYTESNRYVSPRMFPLPSAEPGAGDVVEKLGHEVIPVDAIALEAEDGAQGDGITDILTVCCICAGAVCILAAGVQWFFYRRRRKRRRQ